MKTPPQPTPGFAFSEFAKTRPALQEIAALTGISFDGLKIPGASLLRVDDKLDGLSSPEPNPEALLLHIILKPLKDQLADTSKSQEERHAIAREILNIQTQAWKPKTDHYENISRLKNSVPNEIAEFKNWIQNDPAGIAAAAKDKAHDDFLEAEELRERVERQRRLEAEAAAREEERHRLGIEELRDTIGFRLLQLDPSHSDVDGAAITEFLDWCRQSTLDLSPLNAYLFGPPRVGKTRALAAAAIATAEEHGFESVEWVSAHDFAEIVGDLGTTERRDAATRRLRDLAQCWFLFLDDLGGAEFTGPRTARFFSLIDERYRNERPTFITTNYSPSELKKLFTAKSEAKAEGIRILGRILGTPHDPLAKIMQFKRPSK
jgi:DNA replication protein DnaC